MDAAVGPEGTWSILDQKRSMIFTYDANGELLFAFGDKGEQLGNLKTPSAIVYQDDKLLALDTAQSSFTVYTRTEYGDILISALKANNDRRYDEAVITGKPFCREIITSTLRTAASEARLTAAATGIRPWIISKAA